MNVTDDPMDGSLLLVRQIKIVKGKVEMLHARLLACPIAIPHFAAHKSSLEVKPFEVDAKTHLFYLLFARGA